VPTDVAPQTEVARENSARENSSHAGEDVADGAAPPVSE
jgi:hypothetical protein